jgi:hypothetical protein
MKIPHKVLVKLSPLVELARGEPLIEPFVELAENNADRMTIRSSYGEFLFDKATRRVFQDQADVSAFSEIESVDIGAFPGGRGEKSWSIVLFRSLIDKITVARTYDDGEASVLAAKLARVLGCKVIALTGTK